MDFVQDDAKSLLVYIIEKYYDKLKHIQYVDIFEKMKIKYDQVHNNVSRFILTVQMLGCEFCCLNLLYSFRPRRFSRLKNNGLNL